MMAVDSEAQDSRKRRKKFLFKRLSGKQKPLPGGPAGVEQN
jgi:hypothetical protein